MPRWYCPQKVGEDNFAFCRRRAKEVIDVFDRKSKKLGLPRTPTRETVGPHLRLAISLYKTEKDMGRPAMRSNFAERLACRWIEMIELDILEEDIEKIEEILREVGCSGEFNNPEAQMDKIASRWELYKSRRQKAKQDLFVLGWAITLGRMRHWRSIREEENEAIRSLGKLLIETNRF